MHGCCVQRLQGSRQVSSRGRRTGRARARSREGGRVAGGESAVFDVALTLALLSAFASIAFVKFALRQDQKDPDAEADGGAR